MSIILQLKIKRPLSGHPYLSEAWAVEAADPSSGPAEGSSLGNRWKGTDGACRLQTSPDLRLGSGKLRSCSRTLLAAAASSSFTTSPASSQEARWGVTSSGCSWERGVTHAQNSQARRLGSESAPSCWPWWQRPPSTKESLCYQSTIGRFRENASHAGGQPWGPSPPEFTAPERLPGSAEWGSRSEVTSSRSGARGSRELQHSSLDGLPRGFPMVTTGRAASRSSTQVLFRFKGTTITFPFVDFLFYLDVQADATKAGSCCKEFEDILFHLHDIKGSGHYESFPFRLDGNPEQWYMTPLRAAKKGLLRGIDLERFGCGRYCNCLSVVTSLLLKQKRIVFIQHLSVRCSLYKKIVKLNSLK